MCTLFLCVFVSLCMCLQLAILHSVLSGSHSHCHKQPQPLAGVALSCTDMCVLKLAHTHTHSHVSVLTLMNTRLNTRHWDSPQVSLRGQSQHLIIKMHRHSNVTCVSTHTYMHRGSCLGCLTHS